MGTAAGRESYVSSLNVLRSARVIIYFLSIPFHAAPQENTYANNACLDYLDDSLAARFAALSTQEESTAAQPSTPPRDAAAITGFSPAPAAVAAAVVAPARRRKCLITRIEAFCASHTLENCSW